MKFLQKSFTFDRVVRILLAVLLLAGLVFAFRKLSTVLTPFLVAWSMAWLLFPLVKFFQYKLRLRYRMPSIIAALLVVVAGVTALVYMTAPIFTEGIGQLKDALIRYLNNPHRAEELPTWLNAYFDEIMASMDIEKYLATEEGQRYIEECMPQVWEMFLSIANMLTGSVHILFGILYFFFILADYEYYEEASMRLLPKTYRPAFQVIREELSTGLRRYFRGQALVALSNLVMFTIGFYLIGLPMWIGMGVFVGVISFVPYIQVIGFIPAAILSLLCMVNDGTSFWMMMGLVALVYIVVQVLQDAVFTPRIMGKLMGLPPAIVLLALSVWGSMAGIVGLIVALPLTMLIYKCYDHFVLNNDTEALHSEEEMG